MGDLIDTSSFSAAPTTHNSHRRPGPHPLRVQRAFRPVTLGRWCRLARDGLRSVSDVDVPAVSGSEAVLTITSRQPVNVLL
jgi:hypothetical protein